MKAAAIRDKLHREAERKFPHHVDIELIRDAINIRWSAAAEWCAKNIPDGEWDILGTREEDAPRAYARFYFASEADAEEFRELWAMP